MDSEKRSQERCLEEAGEPITLFRKGTSGAIHGLIVDWSVGGLAMAYVTDKLRFDIGQMLSYSPDILNLVSMDSPDNIEYSVVRIREVNEHIYVLGLQAIL